MALTEKTEVDHRIGRIMNPNLAGYHVPVNADIGEIETIFVPEEDKIVNPLGAKGLGELGLVGIPAAIANAVYHATGKRIRGGIKAFVALAPLSEKSPYPVDLIIRHRTDCRSLSLKSRRGIGGSNDDKGRRR